MAANILLAYNPNATALSNPYYCVENEFYRNLYHCMDRQNLLPVVNNPSVKSGYTHLASHNPMARWEGLYPNLARASAEYLRGCGVSIPATTIQKSQFELVALYMLETCFVIYQSNSEDGIKSVICTKNIELLSSVFQLSPSRLSEIRRYCAENAEEVVSGKIKAAAFGITNEGFTKPHCHTIPVNAKLSLLLPMMTCLMFRNLLTNVLWGGKSAIRLKYHDRFNQRQEIVTSLNPKILYNRVGNHIDISRIGILNPEVPAVLLSLFDMQKKSYVDVPITQIIDVSVES